MSAGVPAPSTYSSRTRWPGAFGATIVTSTSGRTVIVPKRMLKPCANISILPGARFGSMASLYSFAAVVSGTSTMMTSAHFDTVGHLADLEPGRLRLRARPAVGRQARPSR